MIDESNSSETWQCVKKMIYVKMNPKTNVPSGHWPIPEAFWPEPNMKKLVNCSEDVAYYDVLSCLFVVSFTVICCLFVMCLCVCCCVHSTVC